MITGTPEGGEHLPKSTAWAKANHGRHRSRQEGLWFATVSRITNGRWSATVIPTTVTQAGRTTNWEYGEPIDLGTFAGRRSAQAAADEYLASTVGR
jgi:hypothetical protein